MVQIITQAKRKGKGDLKLIPSVEKIIFNLYGRCLPFPHGMWYNTPGNKPKGKELGEHG